MSPILIQNLSKLDTGLSKMHPDLAEQQAMNRVKRYEDQRRAHLHAAIDLGQDERYLDGVGKEWYAFSNHRGDTLLHWLEERALVLCPDVAKRPYCVAGVWFDLIGKHVGKASLINPHQLYVHKKRLRRFLKKAIIRNLY